VAAWFYAFVHVSIVGFGTAHSHQVSAARIGYLEGNHFIEVTLVGAYGEGAAQPHSLNPAYTSLALWMSLRSAYIICRG
jgi:hypothetical protein